MDLELQEKVDVTEDGKGGEVRAVENVEITGQNCWSKWFYSGEKGGSWRWEGNRWWGGQCRWKT